MSYSFTSIGIPVIIRIYTKWKISKIYVCNIQKNIKSMEYATIIMIQNMGEKVVKNNTNIGSTNYALKAMKMIKMFEIYQSYLDQYV